MTGLLPVIVELALRLDRDRVGMLGNKIKDLHSVKDFYQIHQDVVCPKELLDKLERSWLAEEGHTPNEVALALEAAVATIEIQAKNTTELVWTGPSTHAIPIRKTEQVLCELIDWAKSRLFIVSYVAYEVASIFKTLESASERGVQISILLEPSQSKGGKVSHDSTRELLNKIPTINAYSWSESDGASIHAKCAVADSRIAFITSANLTSAAMEKNMELGVLAKGGELPSNLHKHLEALIDTKVIQRVD